MADNISRSAAKYYAERNIWGRHCKLFLTEITTDAQGNQTPGTPTFLNNITEVSANYNVDRMEVRRAGDRIVRYKAGEITGEGSITMDKVNSNFEQFMIAYANRRTADGFEMPMFQIHLSIEDPSQPNIDIDLATDMAKNGHEEIILKGVNFWSLPLGWSITDMLTRDLDFTFQGIEFGTNALGTNAVITDPAGTITRLDS